jgi:hypothetical protein
MWDWKKGSTKTPAKKMKMTDREKKTGKLRLSGMFETAFARKA